MIFRKLKNRSRGEEKIWLPLLSLIIHIMVFIQFSLNTVPQSLYAGFTWQFYLLLALSATGSLMMIFIRNARLFFLLFRLVIILLISYPTGSYIWIGSLLMITLSVEAALLMALPFNQILSLLVIIPLYFFQQDRSAFYTAVSGADLPDLLLLGFLPLLSGQVACLFRKQKERTGELILLNKRLDLAAARLIEANLGYQNYAKQLEARTLNEERRRISREIHDSVGYSLTNIRVMLEAGAIQIDPAPEQAKELILKAMEESRICLEETRMAMREIRGREKPDYRGLSAINRLVHAFKTSTGIEVNLEFGEAPSHFPSDIDKIVYRMIQEAMTNSFRHGMATEVDIMFWYGGNDLQIMIRDNGRGVPSIKEGLGLAGMRERIEQIGGSIEYNNDMGGFQIRAHIPLNNSTVLKGEN